MDELGSLKFEHIEIPHDLHERISARLDLHIYDQKRKPGFAWNAWLRNLAYAGIGAVVIAGSIVALNSRGNVGGAEILPTNSNVDTITLSASSDGVLLHFALGSLKSIVVTDAQGKAQYHRSTVRDTLLSNPLGSAVILGIQFDGGSSIRYVAIPGKDRSPINKGEGTVVDLAKAAADYYRVPVSVETGTPNQRESWTFGSTDVVGELSKTLTKSYGVTLGQNNILEIKESR